MRVMILDLVRLRKTYKGNFSWFVRIEMSELITALETEFCIQNKAKLKWHEEQRKLERRER